MGGGMRQAGFLAAAGIYALDHNIARLKEDNDRAKQIGNCLSQLSYIKEVKPVKTNIVIFSVKPPMSSDDLIKVLAKNQIRAVTIGPGAIRFVTHLDFDEAMCDEVIRVLKELE